MSQNDTSSNNVLTRIVAAYQWMKQHKHEPCSACGATTWTVASDMLASDVAIVTVRCLACDERALSLAPPVRLATDS